MNTREANRFDFEQHLMHAWHVVEDIRLARRLLEQTSMNEQSRDNLDNLLLGFEVKYDLLFQELLDEFETLIRLNKL